MRRWCGALALAAPIVAGAADCTPPEDGNRPFVQALNKVKYLPETERWALEAAKRGATVQYVLSLTETVQAFGLCHWSVEVRSDGRLWKRFYVSAYGESLLAEAPGGALSARSDCRP